MKSQLKIMIRPEIIFFFSLLLLSCHSTTDTTSSQTKLKLELMDSPADSTSAEPYLSTDKNGTVYLSWIEMKPGNNILWYSTFENEKWREPKIIASGADWFVNWADYPQIASDGENNLISHFLEKSDKGTYTYDIRYSISSDDGLTWTDPVILHDDGKKAEHGFVSMVPYEGNYFISWLDGRNAMTEESHGHGSHHGSMTLRGAIVDKAGKKLKEWELDDRVCDCCQTSAAITLSGPVVVYRDRSENEIRDISIVRFVNGQWTRPKSISADNWKINGCPVNGPRIVAEGNTVAVVWFSSPEKEPQVKIAFSENGGETFSDPVRVDEGRSIGRVDLELMNEETAMVSWMEGSEIRCRKVHRTGDRDSSIIISQSSDQRSSGFPQMTRSGDQVIFAWTDDKEKRVKTARLF